MNPSCLENADSKILPNNFKQLAGESILNREKDFKVLLEQRNWPKEEWKDNVIEDFITQLSRLDSNNFPKQCGLGEREGRIFSSLVAKRHYYFSHGIGRSGDLNEFQPKAIGSSLLNKLTNDLILDVVQKIGIKNCKKCLLMPMATGMTMMMCLLSLKASRPNAKYVLWSRIDQKSCIKCILTAGLIPVVINTKFDGYSDQLVTDMDEFRRQATQIGQENIVCIFSTTSCFAPRACDNIVDLALLSKELNVPHLVNNAYGLQSSFHVHQIETASRLGRVDLFVQSSDKNFMVPVGGAIVGSFEPRFIDDLAKSYPGRASSSQCLDLLITLLSLGEIRYKSMLDERKSNFSYLKESLDTLLEPYKDRFRLLDIKDNRISLAVAMIGFSGKAATELGSKLFTRHVSGVRVISNDAKNRFGDITFQTWGNHTDLPMPCYITVAAAIGLQKSEIDEFIKKFEKVIKEEIKLRKFGDLNRLI